MDETEVIFAAISALVRRTNKKASGSLTLFGVLLDFFVSSHAQPICIGELLLTLAAICQESQAVIRGFLLGRQKALHREVALARVVVKAQYAAACRQAWQCLCNGCQRGTR